MTDLHAEIEAAIAEDEQLAKAATQGRWKLWGMEVRADIAGTSFGRAVAMTYHESGMRTFNACHIARHDPASVLRRTAALRQILELHRPHCLICDPRTIAVEPFYCPTFRALADGYGIEVPG